MVVFVSVRRRIPAERHGLRIIDLRAVPRHRCRRLTTSLVFATAAELNRSSHFSKSQGSKISEYTYLTASILLMDMNGYSAGMLPYPDPTQFDYGAFLGGDGAMHFQELTPPHNNNSLSQSPGDATPPSSESRSPLGNEVIRRSGNKQRLERRGHTKSRRGCYNCKRRRIKVSSLPWRN